MEQKINLIKKSERNFRVERPVQTGFSSPATHYNEPRIDLNEILVTNPSATFFIRVADNHFQEFNIVENDVLIVDKSMTPKSNQLVLATMDDTFNVVHMDKNLDSELNIWGVITFIIKSVL